MSQYIFTPVNMLTSDRMSQQLLQGIEPVTILLQGKSISRSDTMWATALSFLTPCGPQPFHFQAVFVIRPGLDDVFDEDYFSRLHRTSLFYQQ